MTKKEKIISKIKEHKTGLIICAIIFVGLLLLNLCRIITNNIVNDSNKNEVVKTEQLFLEHNINKAPFTTSNGSTNQYYFNSVVSMSASYLDLIKGKPLMYFNDDTTTYLYLVVDSGVQFKLTNGFQTQNVAVYSYDSVNYQLNIVTELSDFYFYSIVCDSITYYSYNDVSLSSLNILIQSYDYITNAMGTLYIGYQGNQSFDYAYDLGYQNGLSQGKTDIMNNLVENGLYTTEQYEQSYESGKNFGKTEVLTNPNANGLYTKEQYDDNYNLGYRTAESEVTPDLASNGFTTMVNSILNAPFNIINGMINFEIFGVNVFNVFSFLFTLCLIGFVIKLII